MLTHPDGGLASRRSFHAYVAGADLDPDEEQRVRTTLTHAVPATEQRLAEIGWSWLPATAPEFPTALRTLTDPPIGVFVRGAVPQLPAAAVVGARRASAYGREVAEHLGRELAAAGACVVAGMARGVDAAAHRGALAAGGPTVAVWGAGPDRVYPPEHRELADEIAAHGCLLTEYPPGTPPLPFHFPERNRLIAGLAHVVVVVEADEKSGALITARLALDEGREVMAVPGSVFSRLSAGPNGLLRAGAAPVVSAQDVLMALGMNVPATTPESHDEPAVLAAIPRGEAVSVDHLAAATGAPVAEVLEKIVALEIDGRIVRENDGRFRRSARGTKV